jgi:hypothetical protein
MTKHKHRLGRIESPDSRDHLHLMKKQLPARVALPEYKYWNPGVTLDQRDTGTCVGHAWKGWLMASPIRTKTGLSALQIYRECTKVDVFSGNDLEYELPDSHLQYGTSVRAGAQVLEGRGHIEEYLWAFDLETIKRHVLLRGPVVMGTDWFSGFFYPDTKGVIHPVGAVEGGHAYLNFGYSKIKKAFRCLNSWGTGWGQKGRFWIPEEVMGMLLSTGGEAASAIERKVP